MAENKTDMDMSTTHVIEANGSHLEWWEFQGNSSTPYVRMDHPIAFFFQAFHIVLGLIIINNLKDLYKQLPEEYVTVLTELKHYIAMDSNLLNLVHCCPYLFRQAVCIINPFVGMVLIHVVHLLCLNIICLSIAILVLKQILIQRPGLVEAQAPVAHAQGIRRLIFLGTTIAVASSLIYYLVEKRMDILVPAYWANIDYYPGQGVNIPAIYLSVCCLAGIALLLMDMYLNRILLILKLKRFRSILGFTALVTVVIAITHIFDFETEYPIIGLIQPFVTVEDIFEFVEDAQKNHFKVQEELKEKRARQLFIISNRVPLARSEEDVLEMIDLEETD